MKERTKEIFASSSDLLSLFKAVKEIGWSEMKESTIHRMLYLSDVVYGFKYPENKEFDHYHFSISAIGPYSKLVDQAITELQRRDIVFSDEEGNLSADLEMAIKQGLNVDSNIEWLRTIAYIIGFYGEKKVFGFVIQDPQYKDDFQRNSRFDINTSSSNKTIQTLISFKNAFEETLDDVSEIDDKEYLELYFEYIFSKIIKKD